MSDELKALLIQVITSWQVIGVTVVLIIYLSLVFYVAKFRRVSMLEAIKQKAKNKPKKPKKEPAKPEEAEQEEAEA
jgi:Na+-transporting methylmalonyl-CoA/oxaloacetate decarboxylase gamma subunit